MRPSDASGPFAHTAPISQATSNMNTGVLQHSTQLANSAGKFLPQDTFGMSSYRHTMLQALGRRQAGAPEVPSNSDPLLVMGALNASFVTDGMLYGIHVVLFAMACYILVRFQRRRMRWFLLVAVCSMFAISTVDIGLSIKLSTTDLWVLVTLTPAQSIERMPPKAMLFVTNNLIADILLFHRCWIIWGRPRIIPWIALVCLTADTIWGYLGHAAKTAAYQHTFRPLYLWTVFALNISVTAAAAGRIYYVSIVAIPPNERRLHKICRAIISTLVESAALYSSCILMFLLWVKYDEASAYWVIPLTMMTRLVAIMPTLMIVQLGLSHRAHTHNHDGRTNSKPDSDDVVLDTVMSRMQRDESLEYGFGGLAAGHQAMLSHSHSHTMGKTELPDSTENGMSSKKQGLHDTYLEADSEKFEIMDDPHDITIDVQSEKKNNASRHSISPV
ncbi:hypothetical protein FA15DRAFT_670611 [Coprinopsis marcescibilis]|uniref:Uncharacterized protein n=1 Tax=Coprinopsis marcescibilis TaxID=230819 RepID=A0A5C3KU05_COPMA|nr:hypothetical protein FA15DRAFT_670611 [Coprinopsis marcescibilis]